MASRATSSRQTSGWHALTGGWAALLQMRGPGQHFAGNSDVHCLQCSKPSWSAVCRVGEAGFSVNNVEVDGAIMLSGAELQLALLRLRRRQVALAQGWNLSWAGPPPCPEASPPAGDVFTLWRVQRWSDVTLDSLALLRLLRPIPGGCLAGLAWWMQLHRVVPCSADMLPPPVVPQTCWCWAPAGGPSSWPRSWRGSCTRWACAWMPWTRCARPLRGSSEARFHRSLRP